MKKQAQRLPDRNVGWRDFVPLVPLDSLCKRSNGPVVDTRYSAHVDYPTLRLCRHEPDMDTKK